METPEQLTERLSQLIEPGDREQLLARGLARGMIWQEGHLPPESPHFAETLSNDLLNQGYSILGTALHLRKLNHTAPILDDSFRAAAEAIEAAVRRGVRDEERAFHLTVAAASFHLGHYAARSFSLLAEDQDELNLSSVERVLVALMQRRLADLDTLCLEWLTEPAHTDDGIAARLEEDDEFLPGDASRTVVTHAFHRAVANFAFALRTGDPRFVEIATGLLDDCVAAAEQMRHVPLWWASILARHLIEDLWDRSLHNRLPVLPTDDGSWNAARQNFIDLLTRRDIAEVDLWPSQLSAAERVIEESDSLVVALPTSSGKTRIAELCILKCVSGGRRVVYVTPLRALSAQVEVTLERTFAPLGYTVTSVYGASGIGASDVDTMASAHIVVATPEKLDFAIRQSPEVIDDVGLIVLDEGHMIGLSEREINYEVLVQRLLRRPDAAQRRVVCLSAIFTEGDAFDAFTQWIRADNAGEAIRSTWRPTRQRPGTIEWQAETARLEYRVHGETVFVPRFIESQDAIKPRRTRFPRDRNELIVASVLRFFRDGHSVLVYCPLRGSVETVAEAYLKAHQQGYAHSLLTEEAEHEIQSALRIGNEWLGPDHVAMRALRLGVAVHHGQLPRPFLSELERLLRKQFLRVAISSPTLAQGVDLSFSVLVFSSLWRTGSLIKPKEFANVVGRVGRAYVDLDGIYVLPVYEATARNKARRLNEFHTLVTQAKSRELESGLYLLIRLCLLILQNRLNVPSAGLAEYVLNQQSAIDAFTGSDDDEAGLMQVVLAELDAGILALIDDLDCDVSEVASRLDDALASSYWQRRLAARSIEENTAQTALLRGRAQHVWTRTTSSQRSGFYAASVGTESGLQIAAQSDSLDELLDRCTHAIEQADIASLASGCNELAEILFEIYPFQPRSITDNWQPILSAWVSGQPLASVADADGIAFVQEGLVYRFVWAIEAVRIILASMNANDTENGDDERNTFVAICVTYGVPSIAAARLLESGLESRALAVRLTGELGLTFSTRAALREWLATVTDEGPIAFNDDERAIWQNFVARNRQSYKTWHRTQESITFSPSCDVAVGEVVRVIRDSEQSARVYRADFQPVGSIVPFTSSTSSLVGTVTGPSEIETRRFGPFEMPQWMIDLLT